MEPVAPNGDKLSASTAYPELGTLGERARQTLDLLLEGESEKRIAQMLSISRHTVHAHVKNIHRKLGVCTRAELLSRFIRRDGDGRSDSKPRIAPLRPLLLTERNWSRVMERLVECLRQLERVEARLILRGFGAAGKLRSELAKAVQSAHRAHVILDRAGAGTPANHRSDASVPTKDESSDARSGDRLPQTNGHPRQLIGPQPPNKLKANGPALPLQSAEVNLPSRAH